MRLYHETTSVCPRCAKDTNAHYESSDQGVYLIGECPEHGIHKELVERDLNFFRWGYEQEYSKPCSHLVFPVTYRCNLKCAYCYTLSNTNLSIPDRPLGTIMGMLGSFTGNVTLIGGEPTLREDLFDIIAAAKKMPNLDNVSIATNGQRLRDAEYVKRLKGSGIDFVFLSFNDIEYDMSSRVHINKLHALSNCLELRVPVWLQGTISSLRQLDSFVSVLKTFKKTVFKVTLRAVKAFGINHPASELTVSDILEYLGKENAASKGTHPFNRLIRLEGKEAKVCSWVHDLKILDPLDSDYVISNDTFTKFHRGMRMDEVLLRDRLLQKAAAAPPIRWHSTDSIDLAT